MSYYIYILYSRHTDRIYIGMTNNLERRLNEHNKGQNKSTKAFLPWEKIYQEEFGTRENARKREKYLKNFRGRTWIRENLIHNIK